jgi:GNAT superfamily N-acetyltransferase
MWPKSLFLRTEMIFWRELSEIEDLGNAMIVRTPRNPTWNWGNLLILNEPPKTEDIDNWLKMIDTKLLTQRETTYRLLTWDGGVAEDAVITALKEKGLTPSTGQILTLRTLQRPQYFNPAVHVEQIGGGDKRWSDVTLLNIEAFASQFQNYEIYAERNFAEHRSMIAKGIGKWFVAMVDGEVAGTVGFYPGDGVYRYQEVAVREKFWRQGVAATMIYEVARQGLAEHPDFTQVMVADDEKEAIRVYRSLGFELDSISYAFGGRAQ